MKFKQKILFLFILFMMIFSNLIFGAEPDIASGAGILVESSTGKIIYEKNAFEKMYPASTTKVLTAILTLENCNLEDKATVSHNAVYSLPVGYVNANLQKGEEMSIKDLLYALLVKSANDAAIVLAEHIGSSVEGFADMMNAKAQEIGCQNTHFVNPNGIHNDDHYSTAYDLYLMASYAMKNETFRKYITTTSYTLPTTNLYTATDRICTTTNDLIKPKSKYYNENVIGIKTGHTTEAKNCLISAANKDGVELISVTLYGGTNTEGLSERYVDTNNLFDYGFNDFEFNDFIKKDSVIKNIEIENASKDTKSLDLIAKDTLNAYLNKEFDISSIEPEIKLNENIVAPISAGYTLGTATYTIDNIEYTTELIASHDVNKKFNIQLVILILGIILLILGINILIRSCIGKKQHKKKIIRNNNKI